MPWLRQAHRGGGPGPAALPCAAARAAACTHRLPVACTSLLRVLPACLRQASTLAKLSVPGIAVAALMENALPCKRNIEDMSAEELQEYTAVASSMFADADETSSGGGGATDVAVGVAAPPPHQSQNVNDPVSGALDMPGQYRVLQIPYRSGTRPLLVYEDVNAGPGGRVWDASVGLARYIASNYSPCELCGHSVVEVWAAIQLLPALLASITCCCWLAAVHCLNVMAAISSRSGLARARLGW